MNKKSLMQWSPVVVAVLLLAGGTLVNGKYAERWSPRDTEQLRRFTAAIPLLPKKIGPWSGTDELISDKEFAATNCTAYVSRRFVNRQSGDVVSVYVVSGSARHITIHTPDWCYQGAGYKMQDKPVAYTLQDSDLKPEFLTAEFRKPNPADPNQERKLRIFWTYSYDGDWQGPKRAKITYSARSALYKIYLITDVTQRESGVDDNPAMEFAKIAFPRFNEILFQGDPGFQQDVDENLDKDLQM